MEECLAGGSARYLFGGRLRGGIFGIRDGRVGTPGETVVVSSGWDDEF